MKFRKKPVVIEAVQITPEWFDALHPSPLYPVSLLGKEIVMDPVNRCVFCLTLEGAMRGDIGDWIITGIAGEVYPCKPDIFSKTYEPVSD